MIELIYVSRATKPFSEQELKDLHEESRSYNEENNITGLLLYDGKYTIAQALEGEEDEVKALYDRIRHDPRHTRVSLIHVHKIDKRVFSDWKMGFRPFKGSDIANMRGSSNFLSHPDRLEYLRNHPAFVPRLLYFFIKKNSPVT